MTDNRRQRVLDAIVALYGNGGEPVGSGLLANYFTDIFNIDVSSATLRNDMAALTKLGLLEQPHTSAGRVPSAQGYRVYLERLLNGGLEPLPPEEKAKIDAAFAEMDMEPDHLAESAARSLAQTTGFAVAATTPRADDQYIAHYEVVQVGRNTAAVLAVTSAGGVRTRVARTPSNLTPEDAKATQQLLNSSLTFVSPADCSPQLRSRLEQLAGAKLVPVITAACLLLAARPSVYLEGAQNLVQWQETRVELADLLALFANDAQAARWIAPVGNRLTISVGDDLITPMPGLCVASKRYLAGGGQTGTLAVIGPKRMDHRRLMPVLDYYALKLGQYMAGNN